MTPERWQQIERLYHLALEQEANQRAAFLEEACRGDDGMREEIESLLAHERQASEFMEAPGMAVVAQAVAQHRADSMIGRQLGSYQILCLLGAGGMGEVYKARDTRLGRLVALKILPPGMAADPERKRRFLHEAKAASALNHPHIITLHDVGCEDGMDFLVMEYVPGNTLDKLIPRGGLDLTKALRYAIDITDAVAKAHAAGIIHRDLKPANIMVTEDGAVKVLDFGIAKLTETIESRAPAATAPTKTATEGTILGTTAYMSPEQALGEELDARTDLFSFGVVLYEMATGARPFSGNTSAALFDAILHKTPVPPVQLNPETPAALAAIINKALEKDRELRYQHASELRADLKRLKRDTDAVRSGAQPAATGAIAAGAVRARSRGLMLAASLGGAALIGALVVAFLLRPPLQPPRVSGYVQITHDGQEKSSFGSMYPLLLTDGARIYAQETVGGRYAVAQVSTAGGETVLLQTPFSNIGLVHISPDKSELLVSDATGNPLEYPLWSVPILGGSPRRVGDLVGQDGAWMPDGDLTVAKGNELLLARSDGSASHRFVRMAGFPSWPRWSPDGRTLRFTVGDLVRDTKSLWEVSADGTNPRPLLRGWNNPPAECCGNWTRDGKYFVFQSTRNGRTNIWAIRENGDPFRKASREPVQLTFGPMNFYAPEPSLDGKRIFVVGEQRRAELVRYDTKSGQFVPYLSGISAEGVSFSRDGQWVAYITYPEGSLWRSKTDGSEKLQLSFAPKQVSFPRWSPDGGRIGFAGLEPGGSSKTYIVSANGGALQELPTGEHNAGFLYWSDDGKSIFFEDTYVGQAGELDSSVKSFDLKTGQISSLPGTKGMAFVTVSPDGHQLAATSMDAQKLMLFDVTKQTWQELAKTDIGSANWSMRGKYLYFDTGLGKDQAIFRVRIADRKLERVVGLKEFRRAMGTNGPWSGLTPDDSLLVMRNLGTQEIYALDWKAP